MTLIAICAVVYVPADSMVLLVGLCLGMAAGAGKDGKIIRVGMAGRAYPVRAAVVGGEVRMIERRSLPGARVMARLTSRREAGRRVVRIRGLLIIRLMAPIASSWQGGVVVVHVTVGTRSLGVRASQREGGVVVIER